MATSSPLSTHLARDHGWLARKTKITEVGAHQFSVAMLANALHDERTRDETALRNGVLRLIGVLSVYAMACRLLWGVNRVNYRSRQCGALCHPIFFAQERAWHGQRRSNRVAQSATTQRPSAIDSCPWTESFGVAANSVLS